MREGLGGKLDPLEYAQSAHFEYGKSRALHDPHLALENLEQTEKRSGLERERAEETVIGALGSIYLG